MSKLAPLNFAPLDMDKLHWSQSQMLSDWASSGLMYLCNSSSDSHTALSTHSASPGLCTFPIPSFANELLDRFRKLASTPVLPGISGAQLLCERAALLNLSAPQQQTSANQQAFIFACAGNNFIVLNLARDSDWQTLPALFQQQSTFHNRDDVRNACLKHNASALVTQGRLLGLAIGLIPDSNHLHENEVTTSSIPTLQYDNSKNTNWYSTKHKKTISKPQTDPPLVIDLSSLWAGPLCSHLLQLSGANVVQIQSKHRPDLGHHNAGGQQFHRLLRHNKQILELDFQNKSHIQKLKTLLRDADIVIEGSRPRALQQLGIDAENIVQQHQTLWISISGYGRDPLVNNWVAFGDDAAATAGLIQNTSSTNQLTPTTPEFIGDAIADPLTGLSAALIALTFLHAQQCALIDVNLYSVSRFCAQLEGINATYNIKPHNKSWQLEYQDNHQTHQILIQKPRGRHSLACC